jgi:hypothetical protein
MKLGSQTGSVINHLLSRGTIGQPEPVEGMGATILPWSDRHAATITKVTPATGKRYSCHIDVQYDQSVVVKGGTHDGSAEYEYQRDPSGRIRHFAQRRDTGEWVAMGYNEAGRMVLLKSGNGLRIGSREEYRDPSF